MWNTETDTEESFRNKAIWGSAVAVVLIAAGAFAYYRYVAHPVTDQPVAVAPKPAVPAAPPAIQNPVPPPPEGRSLPALNDSDQELKDSLVGLFGPKPIESFLVPENVVRHIVATVDNLPRNKVAVELRPIRSTAGDTVIATQGEITTLSADNYARYAPFIKVVQAADPKTLASVYFRLYPLFQQAYEDLGYPGMYFNDRLVQVIDNLLDAPDVQGPIQLIQPKVFYQYADPTLESRSAGQKLMIRMGSANAAALKTKLREFRAEIIQHK